MEPDLKHEHDALAENVRHWERLRWVSMTVFLVISGGAFQGYAAWNGNLPPSFRLYLTVLGVAITIIFWVQDERIVTYWKSFKERAQAIETKLGIQVFGVTPKRGLFSSGTAVRVMYLLFLIIWISLFCATI